MMLIPELVSLPHHGHVKKTLKKLKKAYPARFSKVFVREEMVCLYTADEMCSVRSELWRDVLQARGEDLAHLALVEVIRDDAENDEYLFCVLIEDGVVTQQWSQTSLDIDEHVALMGCQDILWVGHSQVTSPIRVIDGLSKSERAMLSSYALEEEKNQRPWLLFGIGVTLMICSATLWYVTRDPLPVQSQVTQPVVVDPYAGYRRAMISGVSAAQSLKQLQTLAVISRHLPPHWNGHELSYSGSSSVLTVTRHPRGKVAVFQQWLNEYGSIQSYVTFDHHNASITTLSTVDMTQWAEKMMPLNTTLAGLQDALAVFGFLVKGETRTGTSWQSVTLTLDVALSLSDFDALHALFISLPITLGPGNFVFEQGLWQGTIQLTLYGG
ncbi:hypothetical protein MACH09_45330 [Vibrio sp. MACH09]|uniref:hypothetical protein n=1 Tax=Vibrio sp. MACH09 TaxID=3025122 RepID=UPI0027908BB5|nr:hypothetical protein [Vibrio sp. MACH09]GLO64025.1 hypothetical protein MACH09_45330 [Vibrio sp. MACH09]